MRSSDLTRRVALLRSTEARDSFGQPIPTWTVLAQVWASIEWLPGNEAFRGDREYAEVPGTVKIRRSDTVVSVREKDRVLMPGGATTLREVLATTTDTSVVVDNGAVFPPENEFAVRVGAELMLVSTKSGGTLTVTRGAFGTTAAKHRPGAAVILMMPADIVSVAIAKAEIALTVQRSEVREVA